MGEYGKKGFRRYSKSKTLKNNVMKKIVIICISFVFSFTVSAQKKEIKPDIDTIPKTINNPNSLTLNHSIDMPIDLKPRHLSNLTYTHKTKYGSFVGIWQRAERFSTQDYEFNLEIYPKINKTTYAYIGGGVSIDNTLFPKHRFGAEIFHLFLKTYEASFGFRHLNFPQENVTFYTASIGKYYKNYWFLLRSYYNPEEMGKSLSITAQARKYGKDANHFYNVSFSFGRGFSEVGLSEYFSETSYRLSLGLQRQLKKNFFINPQIDYRLDETLNDKGSFQNTFIFSLSAKWAF